MQKRRGYLSEGSAPEIALGKVRRILPPAIGRVNREITAALRLAQQGFEDPEDLRK